MRTKWLIVLMALCGFALITACDHQNTVTVSLDQLSDDTSWQCSMDADDVVMIKSEKSQNGKTSWLLEGQNAGEVTVCFTCCADADCTPYVSYTYRVDDTGGITTVGVVGSTTKTQNETSKCLLQALLSK